MPTAKQIEYIQSLLKRENLEVSLDFFRMDHNDAHRLISALKGSNQRGFFWPSVLKQRPHDYDKVRAIELIEKYKLPTT